MVARTRPRAIPLAMITMRNFIDGFPFLSHMNMRLRSGRRSSTKTKKHPIFIIIIIIIIIVIIGIIIIIIVFIIILIIIIIDPLK